MVNCIVKSCRNRGKISGITYHQIPKNNPIPWFDALNRAPSKYVSHRNVVCSRHFKPNDFKGGKRIFLKPNVVPTLHLDDVPNRELYFITPCEEITTTETDNAPETSTVQESLIPIPENLSAKSDSDSSHNTGSSKETNVNEIVSSLYEHDYSKLCAEKLSLDILQKRKRSVISCKETNEEKSASSLDSIGLKESSEKRKILVGDLHTKGKSPRKLHTQVNQLKQRTAIFSCKDTNEEKSASSSDSIGLEESSKKCKILVIDLHTNGKSPRKLHTHVNQLKQRTAIFSCKETNEEKSASSSDSIGLEESSEKRKILVEDLHTYGKSPRKLHTYVNQLKQRTAIFKKKLRNMREKNKRLIRKVSHLQNVEICVKTERKLNMLTITDRNVSPKHISRYINSKYNK